MNSPLSLRPSERYDLLELVGEGGMGRVHRAWDRELARFVALKFIRGSDPSFAQRLLVEARLQGRLDHPHVARIYEVGQLDGDPFIAMQLIKGQSLDELGPGLPMETKLRLLIQVAGAVQAAHQEGLVHRDLKPGNILVEPRPDGELHPYLTDFGLARGADGSGMTTLGFAAGTLPFTSPEQASGEGPVDFRSDVYGLGATLYALLTGRPPFEIRERPDGPAERPLPPLERLPSHLLSGWRTWIRGEVKVEAQFSLIRRVLEEDPTPPSRLRPGLPKDLDTIVLKCLMKNPHQRYLSAQAFAEDLQCLLDGRPIQARAARRVERVVKWVARHRALARTIALGSLLLVITVFGWIRATWRGRERAAMASRMGSEAQALQSELRAAYLLPAHDVRVDKARVRDALDQLRREIDLNDGAADPVGAYALGCGDLALGDLDAAQAHLETAWREGNHAAEVAAALGWTYERLYQRGRAELLQRIDPDHRAQALDELSRRWRTPALELLRGESKISPGERALMEGFLALAEDRYEDGLAAASQVQRLSPARYEGRSLEASLKHFHAMSLIHKGQVKEGLILLGDAISTFDQALDVGRSDPLLFLQAAQCRYDQALALGQVHGARSDDFTAPLDAVDKALAVDPDDTQALLLKSDILMKKADALYSKARPSLELLDEAIALARKAIHLAPDRAYGWEELAQALEFKVWRSGDLDIDVRDLCLEALHSVDQSLALAEASPFSHYLRASLHAELAANEMKRRGTDPRPEIALAEKGYLRVISLGNDRASLLLARCRAMRSIAQYEMDYGLDPSGTASRIEGLYRKGLRDWPEIVQIQKEFSVWNAVLGEWHQRRGEDPKNEADEGIALAQAAHRADTEDSILEGTLVRLHTLKAWSLLRYRKTPLHSFQAASAAGDRSRKLNPQDPDLWLALARLHLCEAEWQVLRRNPAGPFLNKARLALEAGARVDPRSPDFPLLSARVSEQEARELLAKGFSARSRQVRQAIRRAKTELQQASERSPSRLGIREEMERLSAIVPSSHASPSI